MTMTTSPFGNPNHLGAGLRIFNSGKLKWLKCEIVLKKSVVEEQEKRMWI